MDQLQDNNDYNDDKVEQTWALNYAMGGFTVGYQWAEEDLGLSTGASKYENTGYGITFAVNDDLSIGYNNYESEQTNTTNVTAEASSFQIAYSMGGASVRLATGSIDNASYQTTAMYDRDNTVLSISLAF
jgi:outer membrane protein OmpU